MKCDVLTLDNKKAGSVDLADGVFGAEVRKDIIARMVNYQLAKRRSGNHKTKTVSEIRGTTAKPWNQKGTGRARQGTTRAPHYRGGGRAFGPQPRSYAFKLPKKVRANALRSALSKRVADGSLVILDELSFSEIKTKQFVGFLDAFEVNSALVVLGGSSREVELSSRNVAHTKVLRSEGVNVYDLLRYDRIFVTREAIAQIEERFSA